jgi:N-acetyllactosaminide beta-1,3-N-acetylglucosaminyltransferase
MIVAGYQFQVLSPIFSCHWGLQTRRSSYNPSRNMQVKKNAKLVTSFEEELAARYPTANRTC